jgi:hypothetical protein
MYPVSTSTCSSWVNKNNVTHPVLRDKGGTGSVAQALGMKVKDVVVMDRYLKIVFKGQVTGSFEQNQVLSVLSGLK